MGKGDKKSRRGKIILGTYGVRRTRKKAYKLDTKPANTVLVKEPKVDKPLKEKKEVIPAEEPKETKVVVEKAAAKAPRAAKEKKVVQDEKVTKEPKPKKEKKS